MVLIVVVGILILSVFLIVLFPRRPRSRQYHHFVVVVIALYFISLRTSASEGAVIFVYCCCIICCCSCSQHFSYFGRSREISFGFPFHRLLNCAIPKASGLYCHFYCIVDGSDLAISEGVKSSNLVVLLRK